MASNGKIIVGRPILDIQAYDVRERDIVEGSPEVFIHRWDPLDDSSRWVTTCVFYHPPTERGHAAYLVGFGGKLDDRALEDGRYSFGLLDVTTSSAEYHLPANLPTADSHRFGPLNAGQVHLLFQCAGCVAANRHASWLLSQDVAQPGPLPATTSQHRPSRLCSFLKKLWNCIR